jgi:hypothetical protein
MFKKVHLMRRYLRIGTIDATSGDVRWGSEVPASRAPSPDSPVTPEPGTRASPASPGRPSDRSLNPSHPACRRVVKVGAVGCGGGVPVRAPPAQGRGPVRVPPGSGQGDPAAAWCPEGRLPDRGRGGGGSVESAGPTWVRMVRTTAGSCPMAMTRSQPPARGQARRRGSEQSSGVPPCPGGRVTASSPESAPRPATVEKPCGRWTGSGRVPPCGGNGGSSSSSFWGSAGARQRQFCGSAPGAGPHGTV